MGQALAVRGGHGLGDLADELVGVVRLQRPVGEHRGELGGVRQPLMDHVDEVVLLDGVQDLDEPGVTQQRRGTGGGQHRPAPGVVGRQDVHADGAAQLLVDRTPAAESVQTGDALLEAVASGKLVAAVQFRWLGFDRRGTLLVGALGVFFPAGYLFGLSTVVRGLTRLGGQRFLTACVSHVDGSRAPFRHRRSCLPIRCRLNEPRQLCPQSATMHDTRWQSMVVLNQRPSFDRTMPTRAFSSSMRILRAAT